MDASILGPQIGQLSQTILAREEALQAEFRQKKFGVALLSARAFSNLEASFGKISNVQAIAVMKV